MLFSQSVTSSSSSAICHSHNPPTSNKRTLAVTRLVGHSVHRLFHQRIEAYRQVPTKLTDTACRTTVRAVAFGLVFLSSFIRASDVASWLLADSVISAIVRAGFRANSYFGQFLLAKQAWKVRPAG